MSNHRSRRSKYGNGKDYSSHEVLSSGWGRKPLKSGTTQHIDDRYYTEAASPFIWKNNHQASPKYGILATILLLIAWTLLAIITYSLLSIIAAEFIENGNSLLQSGKNLADTVGIDKALIDKFDVQGLSSSAQQPLAWLINLIKPTIITLWFLGALVIAILPLLISRSSLLRQSKH